MKKKGIILVLFSLIISIILGVFSQYTPKIKGADSPRFSAELAKEHIKEIAKEPHSVNNQDALKDVREYILGELNELGLSPEVFTYENVEDRNGELRTLNNIYAKIDGSKGEEGSYILLASHYDSSPKKRLGEDNDSHGAADAGYGVSTILEVLRNIKESGKILENGVKILITDGEEVGLIGAKEEMKNNFSNYENVSFVINIEARGIKGPALMFETSINNDKVIDLYKKANLPVSYSLASDVYRRMPNGSDFTEFLKKDMSGINFAVLNNLDYYHTKEDNYNNISESSIQHYGEQILPIVQEFVSSKEYSDKDYFKSDKDAVFFTFLPNVFIKYSSTIALVLAVLAFGSLVIITKKSNQSIRNVAKWTGIWLGFGIASLVVGIAISYIISIITGVKFSLTYMPKVEGADLITVISIIGLVIASMYIVVRLSRKDDHNVVLLGGLWFNLILLAIFMLVLQGGAYLFLWPILISTIILLIKFYVRNCKYLMLIPLMFTTIMYVPVLVNIYIALTIGALGVVMLLALFALSIILSLVNYVLFE